MITVDVNTGKRYNILIERGLLDKVGELALGVMNKCKAAIITDDKVDALYSDRLEKSLRDSGFETVKFVFPNGENSKNANTFIDILEFLAENRLSRSDAVFALGGGVVGDIAGFAASAFLRGISFVQIPTTLLAAVDSSVGGKTAIDLKAGKNLAGAFYQPKLVVCDPDLLNTLDKETFNDGCAEVIKYAAIRDAEIFDMMKDPDKLDVEKIIRRSVEIKRDVVSEDEFDNGIRQILNFGHTFGHAVEKCSNFKITHGSAVAIGMAIMARGAAAKGLCTSEYRALIEETVKKYGHGINTEYSAKELYEVLLSDKKIKNGSITLVIPRKPGECELIKASFEEALELLTAGL